MKLMFDFVQTACVIVVMSYLLSRANILQDYQGSAKLSNKKLVIVSATFLFIAIYGMTFKTNLSSGLYVDTRVAGIALAGLLFGYTPAAIVTVASIAFTIFGGIGYIAPDSVAMVMACLLTGYCHKRFPDLDAALSGAIVGLFEIVHMLLIVFMIKPVETAKAIVYTIAFPMIVVNGLAVAVFVLIMKDVSDRKRLWEEENFSKSQMVIAKNIQMSLLDKNFNIDPRLDLNVFLEPALDVGGDLYAYILDDNRYFKFIIGDVSGKGISAAIMMSRCVTLFQEMVRTKSSPAEITTELNDRLCMNNDAQMFVTAMIGSLDLETGELVYSNAGHLTPYVVENDEEAIPQERPRGLPLGIFEGGKYNQTTINIKPGQYIVFYTDGITEAENIYHELYGEERMKEALSLIKMVDAKKAQETLIADVRAYTDGAKQSDDIAIFAFGLNEKVIEYSIENKMDELTRISADINSQLGFMGVNKELKDDIAVIIEEIVSNTIKFGYSDERDGKINIKIKATDIPAVIEIEDDSDTFDCLSQNSPVVDMNPQDRPIGGMGVHMTKNRVESHTYTAENGVNRMTVVVRSKEK